MSIQTEKLKLIQLLLNTENQSILDQIKAVFQKSDEKDIWLELSEDQKMEINNAIEESLKGQTIEFGEYMSQHRK